MASHISAADPAQLKPLSAQQAIVANSAIPLFKGPIDTSPPFVLARLHSGELAGGSALGCLTAAVYYEAGGEPIEGRRAVAQVVLNRLRHPAYPKSVCGVVFQGSQQSTGCQFTFTCDGSLARTPSRRGWAEAENVARSALSGTVEPEVGTATNYHAVYVLPYWASSLQKIAMIGNHVFYRFPGFWGRREALNGVYAGEPVDAAGQLMAATAALAGGGQEPAAALPPLKFEPPSVLLAASQSALPQVSAAPLKADEQRGTLIADEPALRGN